MDHHGDGLTREQILGSSPRTAKINGAQWPRPRAMLAKPALDRVAFAILFFACFSAPSLGAMIPGSSPGRGVSGMTRRCPGATTVAASIV